MRNYVQLVRGYSNCVTGVFSVGLVCITAKIYSFKLACYMHFITNCMCYVWLKIKLHSSNAKYGKNKSVKIYDAHIYTKIIYFEVLRSFVRSLSLLLWFILCKAMLPTTSPVPFNLWKISTSILIGLWQQLHSFIPRVFVTQPRTGETKLRAILDF